MGPFSPSDFTLQVLNTNYLTFLCWEGRGGRSRPCVDVFVSSDATLRAEFSYSGDYQIYFPGKNAKLPGYMDYLHLSTADVAILKGSWSVLEEHVTRVSAGESLPTILS